MIRYHSLKGWLCQMESVRTLALHKTQDPFKSQCVEDWVERKKKDEGTLRE